MVSHTIRLRELIQPVPTCSNATPVMAALELLIQSNSDRLILVDAYQQPLGLVRLNSLLPHFSLSFSPSDSASSPAVGVESLEQMTPSIIEPLVVLPDEWMLQDVLSELNLQNNPMVYAVVDQEGQCLGLLDTIRTLQILAQDLTTSRTASLRTESLQPLDAALPSKQAEPPPQRQVIQLTQQLLVQRAELERTISDRQEEIDQLRGRQEQAAIAESNSLDLQHLESLFPSRQTLVSSLLQFMDRLPMPLMLQTSSGKVLVQNSIWRKQVGELSDPAWVQREASVWLEEGISEPSTERRSLLPSGRELPEPNSQSSFPSFLQADYAPAAALASSASPFSEESLCHLGSAPNSCVCVCPLKDGREQVLKFVKIPLGSLLPNWNLDWSESDHSLEDLLAQQLSDDETEIQRPFRLAALSHLEEGAAGLDGAIARSSAALANTDAEDTESLWLVMAQDVTEQEQLARELTAKNADLVQLNRLKDEFLACISHELKTPLTAVLGLSSLLKDQTLGEMNPRQVHYAQLIYQSSRHLMAVVNDILDLTRIETGQLDLLFDCVSISTVCNRAFEQASQQRLLDTKLEDALSEEHITAQFSLEIDPGVETLVADEVRLRQMLVHLLSNSLKFTAVGKPIGLKVGRWGGWIAFTVWDTGMGIPADKQHLIFQKFQQLENPLTRQFEGAGLGLVLTRRLARLHGGDVTFISQEGQGSQFTILLPPAPPGKTQLTRGKDLDMEDTAESWSEAYPGGRVLLYSHTGTAENPVLPPVALAPIRNRLMLVVEAAPQFVEAISDKLTGLGYRVVVARSGTEALEKARRLQPCIIFLNPLLPLLSGWDVLTLLKSNAETQHIPVVITATGVNQDSAHRMQGDGFLGLPIQTKELQQTLQQLLVEPKDGEARSLIVPNLTILRLHSVQSAKQPDSLLTEDLNKLLQSHRYRILESDDLEQAELMARVWKPNVVLLDGAIAESAQYLKQLSSHPTLAALPLVTVDSETTQIANQIPGLLVFPCLAASEGDGAVNQCPNLTTLLQVIQIAAGYVWRPSILAINLSTLPLSLADGAPPVPAEALLGTLPKETEWLQALTQYIQTAGFRGAIAHSWQEVLQQVQSQSVDLLLLCWTGTQPQPEVLEILSRLQAEATKPPILVLDHCTHNGSSAESIPLPAQIYQLATQVLSPPISMTELLARMHQVMTKL